MTDNTNTIRYFQHKDQQYELFAGNELAANLIEVFGGYNTNNDAVLTDDEILAGLPKDMPKVVEFMNVAAQTFQQVQGIQARQFDHSIHRAYSNETLTGELSRRHDRKIKIETKSIAHYFPDSIRMRSQDENLEMQLNYFLGLGIFSENNVSELQAFVDNKIANLPDVYSAMDYAFGSCTDPQLLAAYYHTDRVLFLQGEDEPALEMCTFASMSSSKPVMMYPGNLIPTLFCVKKFEQDFKSAGDILAKHHPELLAQNVTSLLVFTYAREILNLQSEDAVQDIGAAYAADDPNLPALALAFDRQTEGWLDYKKWTIATQETTQDWTGRYPLMSQGFGLGQIILGLANEAYQKNQSALIDYNPHLSVEDFADTNAIIRASIDPKKSIYLKAFVLDFLLLQVENQTESWPNYSVPIDGLCVMEDRQAAREWMILDRTQTLSVFPEADEIMNQYTQDLSSMPNLERWLWLGQQTGFPLNVNGLSLNQMTRYSLMPDGSLIDTGGFLMHAQCR